jgi:hypothetical protein
MGWFQSRKVTFAVIRICKDEKGFELITRQFEIMKCQRNESYYQ